MQENIHQSAQLASTLLAKVASVITANEQMRKERVSSEAPEFQVFNYFRHLENDMSQLLRELLDIKGSHGQGALFLDAFVTLVRERISKNMLPKAQGLSSHFSWLEASQQTSIQTEKTTLTLTTNRRMDVFMQFEDGLLGIENKPTAADQRKQLQDYADELKRLSKSSKYSANWVLVFLSNREPSDDSITTKRREKLTQSGNYLQLTFSDLENYIRGCIGQINAPRVQQTLIQFADYLRQTLNGKLSMELEEAICNEVAHDPIKIQSAFAVSNSLDYIKRMLFEKLRTDLERELKQSNPLFVLSTDFNSLNLNSTTKDMSLCPYLEPEDACWLYFSFEQKDFNYFHWYVWQKKPVTDEKRPFFHKHFSHFGDRSDFKSNTVYWECLWNSHEIPKDWRDDSAPWLDITSGEMVKKMMRAIFDIRTAMKNAKLIETVGLQRPV